MGNTYIYDASLQVNSDWAEFEITDGGASLSFPVAEPSTDSLDGATTIKWGKRQSYSFDSVDISFQITLDTKPTSINVSTFKGDDGYKKGDGEGKVVFNIGGAKYTNTNKTGDGLNQKDFKVDMTNVSSLSG